MTSPRVRKASPILSRPVLAAIVVYMVALPAFLNFALPIYTSTQRILAWFLFATATTPIFYTLSRKLRGVPLLALVGAQYVVFYSLPVFFEDWMPSLAGFIQPEPSAIDMTLSCALLSLLGIAIGYVIAGKVLRLRFQTINFVPSAQRLFWYAVATLIGAALLQLGQGKLLGWSPGSLIRPLSVILSVDLAIAILACLFYKGVLAPWQRVTALGLMAMAVVVGFSGGMFQSAVQPLLIWAVCRWVIKGKTPIFALVFIASVFFILQPIKGTYRAVVLLSGRSFTTSEKVTTYVGLIKRQWIDGNSDAKYTLGEQNRRSAQMRLSLLMSTAHYIEWTPYPFEFKNGSTLTFLMYAWIPRAVWPEKPIAQEANKILPVEYGIQSAANLNTTMFGVGHVAEAYVNFGLAGILPIFMILGMLYRVPQLLLERRHTVPAVAIFVAVAMSMVPIGSSISDAFGGFIQQLILQGLLLRVFTAGPKPRRVFKPGVRTSIGGPPLAPQPASSFSMLSERN